MALSLLAYFENWNSLSLDMLSLDGVLFWFYPFVYSLTDNIVCIENRNHISKLDDSWKGHQIRKKSIIDVGIAAGLKKFGIVIF